MVTLERTRRVGRSQAASIFWGLVSVFFAAAACYYFWKFHENETSANALRDQVLNLQEDREALNSQKQQLQANISDTEAQLKTREEFLQDKETKLGEEESQLELMAAQSDSKSEQGRAQATVVRKFNEAVRKLVKGQDTDVVVRGGRPVLRVPDSVFFDYGQTALKPEGRTLLKQLALALDGQLDNFELRVDAYSDSSGETGDQAAKDSPTTTPDPSSSPAGSDSQTAAQTAPAKPSPGWDLTGRRAGMIAWYLRAQTPLPFQNVVVVPRADFQPIITAGPEAHARNRRVEITIAPLPLAYHPVALLAPDTSTPAEPVTNHKDKTSASGLKAMGKSSKSTPPAGDASTSGAKKRTSPATPEAAAAKADTTDTPNHPTRKPSSSKE